MGWLVDTNVLLRLFISAQVLVEFRKGWMKNYWPRMDTDGIAGTSGQ